VWKLIKEVRTSILESSAFNYLHVVDEWNEQDGSNDMVDGGKYVSVRTIMSERHS